MIHLYIPKTLKYLIIKTTIIQIILIHHQVLVNTNNGSMMYQI